MINRVGLSTDPYGIPFSRENVVDRIFRILTQKVLFAKKFIIKFGKCPLIPQLKIVISILYFHVVSNARV